MKMKSIEDDVLEIPAHPFYQDGRKKIGRRLLLGLKSSHAKPSHNQAILVG
jgi:hypothetical protein